MSLSTTVFISVVTSEFGSCRTLLETKLNRPNLHPKTQERFGVTGGTTLDKLDEYVRHCDAVVHLVGKARGAIPPEPAVADLLALYPDLPKRVPMLAEELAKPQPGFSYTQWEAYLALYHQRHLFVFLPTDFHLETLEVIRDSTFELNEEEAKSQQCHFQRIRSIGRDRITFQSAELLASEVLRALIEILPHLAPPWSEAPPLPVAFFRRMDCLMRVSSGIGGEPPRVRIIFGDSGTGKSALAVDYYNEAKRCLKCDQVSAWIDCRAHFQQPVQWSNEGGTDKLALIVFDNVGENHPVVKEGWVTQFRNAFVIITTTRQQVVKSIQSEAAREDCTDVVVSVQPFSESEQESFFESSVSSDARAAVIGCAAAVGGAPIALQFLREIAMRGSTHLKNFDDAVSLKDLVETWMVIADVDGSLSEIVDCLASVAYVGMDQEALAWVLEHSPKQIRQAVEKLQKLGALTIVSAPEMDAEGQVLVLHERLREVFRTASDKQTKKWSERYGQLLEQRLGQKGGPGVLTCVDAWLAGWNEVFDETSALPYAERQERHKARLKTLLDVPAQSWTSALVAIPDMLASHSKNLADELCSHVIGVGHMVHLLPKNSALAATVWTGSGNKDFWARSSCMAAATRHWRQLGRIFHRHALSEIKLWLQYAYYKHDNDRWLPAEEQSWSADIDADFLVAISALLRMDMTNEAMAVIRAPEFKRRFPALTFCELALIVHFADKGLLEGTDPSAAERNQLFREWTAKVAQSPHAVQSAGAAIGTYLSMHCGVQFESLLGLTIKDGESKGLDLANLCGSERLYKHVELVAPNSSLYLTNKD